MKVNSAVSSTFYAVGQLGLGLLLHPYQTSQGIVQEKVFSWMALFPSVILAMLTVLWRFFIVPLVRQYFSCAPSHTLVCGLLPFVSNWLTFFCIYWQILLLYLFFRFSAAFRK